MSVRFTKHAREKFRRLKAYGFFVNEADVIDSIHKAVRVDRRGSQYLALRPIDEKYALRVVYEERNGYLLVITFYPVRRSRYGV